MAQFGHSGREGRKRLGLPDDEAYQKTFKLKYNKLYSEGLIVNHIRYFSLIYS